MPPPSCHQPLRYLYALMTSPLSLQTKQSQLLQYLLVREELQSLNYLCGLHWTLSLSSLCLRPHSWTQMCPPSRGGRINSLDLLVTLLLMHSRVPLALLAARAHFWLVVSLSPREAPTSFFESCSPVSQPPACTGTWGCSSLGAGPE